MKMSPHLHLKIRFKNLLITFILLCLLAALAWLSARYSMQMDWTANSRNTLSEPTKKTLDSLTGAIDITAYIDEKLPVRNKIAQIVNRYSQHKPDVQLHFVAPKSQPETIRELNIGSEGAIIISYQGRTEKLTVLNESSLTNTLLRLANANERWISFLSGHGERSPFGQANHDFMQFRKELERLNSKVLSLDLATLAAIPENTSVLVIAAPRVALLPGEIEIILQYVQRGGNLFWLTDPGQEHLQILADQLGIKILPGTVVDTSSQLYGVDDPSFVLISKYSPHPITQNLQTMTIYPVAAALETDPEIDYESNAFLTSVRRSWTETGPISGTVRFDADSDEREGPVDIAVALNREITHGREQRIVVIGDGDFLSNAYIGNVGNLDMGMRIINWLSHEDDFIDVPSKVSIGKNLEFSKTLIAVMGFGFLIILPLLLFGTGFFIWRRRKRS